MNLQSIGRTLCRVEGGKLNNKIITISNFKIRVLVGGLDMDAP
jgi:hypothetical protein